MSESRTRVELEARLKEAGDAIGRRVDALEKSVRPDALEKGRQLASQPAVRFGSVVLAGLAVGWLIAGVGSRRRRRNRSAADWASDVEEAARRRVDQGQDSRSALRRALRDVAEDMPERRRESSGRGLFAMALGYAVRSGVTALVQSLARERMNQTNDDSDQDAAG